MGQGYSTRPASYALEIGHFDRRESQWPYNRVLVRYADLRTEEDALIDGVKLSLLRSC